ncbi:Uncharacterized protein HZ326_23147 [Fusarium oxysporum f. sp. albedinis]|nr:Uncharacterized protein HZ326_23147 [Fusarium oxysporum f. sp. albedinis]
MKQIKETGKLPGGKPLLYNKVYLIPTKDKQVWTTLPVFPLLICLFSFPLEEIACQKRHEGRGTTPEGAA